MNAVPPRIRVLCVDDHPLVRQGIASLMAVERDMEVVAEAGDGQGAIERFRACRPDVTLMDLQMPGMNGLDAVRAICDEFPDARILVLTTYPDDLLAQRAIEAGAVGFLLKSALHGELLDAVRRVHAGRVALPSEASLESAKQASGDEVKSEEISLLRFMITGGVRAEVARALSLSEQDVEEQARAILARLSAQHHAQAAGAVDDDGLASLLQAERAARHEAEAANRAKSQFIVSVSHEMRTPLNAVLGYAQLLVLEGGLNASQARKVETIHQSGRHLLALINDVLDLARIEAGRADLNPVPMRLPELLQSTLSLMNVMAEEKGLALLFDRSPGLPDRVCADEKRLRQVLLNLLGNAIKFTEAGSVTLHASAQVLEPGRVLLELDVEDTGVGMHADDLTRIFKPFEQFGDAQRRLGGTGLGLSITHALVQEMGGRVRVASEAGQGSCFSVELPLALPESAT